MDEIGRTSSLLPKFDDNTLMATDADCGVIESRPVTVRLGVPIAKSSLRKFRSFSYIHCMLCSQSSPRIQCRSWIRHCRRVHPLFVLQRMKWENVSEHAALYASLEDHVSKLERNLTCINEFISRNPIEEVPLKVVTREAVKQDFYDSLTLPAIRIAPICRPMSKDVISYSLEEDDKELEKAKSEAVVVHQVESVDRLEKDKSVSSVQSSESLSLSMLSVPDPLLGCSTTSGSVDMDSVVHSSTSAKNKNFTNHKPTAVFGASGCRSLVVPRSLSENLPSRMGTSAAVKKGIFTNETSSRKNAARTLLQSRKDLTTSTKIQRVKSIVSLRKPVCSISAVSRTIVMLAKPGLDAKEGVQSPGNREKQPKRTGCNKKCGKSSLRKYHTKDALRCLLCPRTSPLCLVMVRSWRRHCARHHKEFIAYRASLDGISAAAAIDATFEDHVAKDQRTRDLKHINEFVRMNNIDAHSAEKSEADESHNSTTRKSVDERRSSQSADTTMPTSDVLETELRNSIRLQEIKHLLVETSDKIKHLTSQLIQAQESKKRLISLLNDAAQVEDILQARLEAETERENKLKLQFNMMCEMRYCVETKSGSASVVEIGQDERIKKTKYARWPRKKKIFSCPICKKSFAPGLVLRHMREEHYAKESTTCEYCDKTFTNRSCMRQHRALHLMAMNEEQNEEPQSLCSVCGESFRTKYQLHAHNKKKHAGKNGYKCDRCEERFSSYYRCRVHMMQHEDLEHCFKPFNCTVCAYKSYSQRFLLEHMCTHTGERPYLCAECGTSFGFETSYKRHLLTHSDARPFRCTECGKTFRFHQQLKHHMHTHSSVKRYVCAVCSARYRNWYDLRNHEEMHTGMTRFAHRCAMCGRKYVTKEKLDEHMHHKHGGDGDVGSRKDAKGRREVMKVEVNSGWEGEECDLLECVVDGSF